MAKHLGGQGQIQSHQHGRPDDGVETQNLLADHVDVSGPVLIKVVVGIVIIAQCGDVVGKCIDPHIDGVLGVKRNLDAPGNAGTGYTGILQALLDEGDHLVFAGSGLDEIRVLVIIFQQAVSVFAGLEEVGFLLCLIDRAAAVGALAVFQLGFSPEAFARLAVHALIGALVDITLVMQLGKDLLHTLDMIVIGGTDKAVIADVHGLPQVLDGSHNGIHVFLRRYTLGGGLILDLLAVLVGTRQEHDVIALHPLVACQCITGHGGIAVANVQLIAGVIDGCCDVKLFVFHIYNNSFPE